jgi:hypothetical protein
MHKLSSKYFKEVRGEEVSDQEESGPSLPLYPSSP